MALVGTEQIAVSVCVQGRGGVVPQKIRSDNKNCCIEKFHHNTNIIKCI